MFHCYCEIFLSSPVGVGREFFFSSRLTLSLFFELLRLFGEMNVLKARGKVVRNVFHLTKKTIGCFKVLILLFCAGRHSHAA